MGGWGNCGTDSKGRPIGYYHSGRCDHPGCKTKLERSLSYACGGMHGQDGLSCEGYFCSAHMSYARDDIHEGNLCKGCAAKAESEGLKLCDECAHFVDKSDFDADERKCRPCTEKPRVTIY